MLIISLQLRLSDLYLINAVLAIIAAIGSSIIWVAAIRVAQQVSYRTAILSILIPSPTQVIFAV